MVRFALFATRLLCAVCAFAVLLSLSVALLNWFNWLEYSSDDYYHGAEKVNAVWNRSCRVWLYCGIVTLLGTVAAIGFAFLSNSLSRRQAPS